MATAIAQLSPELEKIKELLSSLGNSFEQDDREAHDFYRRRGRKLQFYWNSFQNIYYNDVLKEFRQISETTVNDDLDSNDLDEYDTTINIFRAYGESIIAAAASGMPHARFFPADANNPDDILAAKASSRCSELIAHHNDGEFLFIHCLFTLWTQSLLAIYNYSKTDAEFGTIQKPILEIENVENTYNVCPDCGFETQDLSIENCPTCASDVDEFSIEPIDSRKPLVTENRPDTILSQTGSTEIPKRREILEVYGTANLKVPYYVRTVADAPYIVLETDHHVSLLRELYPNFYDDIVPNQGDPENFRRPTDGHVFSNRGLATLKRYWLRPWAYNNLSKEDAALLKKKYPDGVHFVKIGDVIVECRNEKLDNHWTLYRDPLSTHINSQPLGQGVVPVQDMRSDLVYLTMDTIKHGVGETFVDSDVLNWDIYKEHRNKAGQIVPVARKRKDTNLDGSFYQTKNATLSKEVSDFFFMLNRDGEFISRAMPSIFGGVEQGGSATLGEHESKKNQALQRLTLPWKSVNKLYAKVMEKAVPEFVKNMIEDEKFVEQKGSSFVNIYIRKADFSGKTGKVISEVSDQFPVSWAQKKDMILQLLGMQKEPIDAALFHPENTSMMAELFGLADLHVPGDSDRNKQLYEIQELLVSQPVQDMAGAMTPSVMVEPEVDNHQIHIEAIRAWATSDEGQEAKITNPAGYQNVIAHLNAHLMSMAPPPEVPEETNNEV